MILATQVENSNYVLFTLPLNTPQRVVDSGAFNGYVVSFAEEH